MRRVSQDSSHGQGGLKPNPYEVKVTFKGVYLTFRNARRICSPRLRVKSDPLHKRLQASAS